VSIRLSASLAVALASSAWPAPASGAPASGWSPPRLLSACAVGHRPQVVFPSESPSVATGPGAIVWAEDPTCRVGSQSASARTPELSVASLDPHDRVGGVNRQTPAGWEASGLDVAGASKGRIAVALALRAPGAPVGEAVTVLQGRATGALDEAKMLTGTAGRPSLAHAYLGDAAVASVELRPRPAIAVSVERFFRSGFGRVRLIPIPDGHVSALTATMDYRSDVLVAWQQNGAIYAHMLRASGRPEPTQRVGPGSPESRLQVLVSDNDHGMIAWSSHAPGPSSTTTVMLALSGGGVRFDRRRMLASFPDPTGAAAAAGALALVRLSSENVMLAWTEADRGRLSVRAAPAVFAGTQPSVQLSDPAREAVLAALAAGPAGEAVALWRSVTPGPAGFDGSRGELWAARAFIERHGRVGFRPAERVAPSGASSQVGAAIDPASDRPVAAWLVAGGRALEYSTGPSAPGYRAGSPAAAVTPGAAHDLRTALIAAAAVAILAVIGLAARRRSAASPAGRGSRRRG
jgi:hypothetical protein